MGKVESDQIIGNAIGVAALKECAPDSPCFPPGLSPVGVVDLALPPGLDYRPMAPPPGDFSRAISLAGVSVEEQQLRAINDQLRLENHHLQAVNELLVKENSTLRAEFLRREVGMESPAYSLGLLKEPIKVDVSTFKPSGFGMPGLQSEDSNISVASTVATLTGEEECSELEERNVDERTARQDAPRELRIERQNAEGLMKIHWPVDAKKLKAKDRQIISPSFEILPGIAFKLMLKPKSVGDRKGQAGFQKAKGFGSVELKFIEGAASAPSLRFRVTVGQEAPRDPVECDFGKGTVCALHKNSEDFDFLSAVDPDSSTLLVCLEVFPQRPFVNDVSE